MDFIINIKKKKKSILSVFKHILEIALSLRPFISLIFDEDFLLLLSTLVHHDHFYCVRLTGISMMPSHFYDIKYPMTMVSDRFDDLSG